ncbi:MAG: hypothetical protein E7319_00170 [Clostridiales bacterium]|nr:hypothetical protein [Clostridiales bacterium]
MFGVCLLYHIPLQKQNSADGLRCDAAKCLLGKVSPEKIGASQGMLSMENVPSFSFEFCFMVMPA